MTVIDCSANILMDSTEFLRRKVFHMGAFGAKFFKGRW